MANVPQEVQRLWDNGAVVSSFTLTTDITAAKGAKMGKESLVSNGFNNRTVIGMALVVGDGDGTKGASVTAQGTPVMLYTQCALSQIDFTDADNKAVVSDLPLLSLVPPVGKQYVPFYLPNFNPGKSFLKWADDLSNTGTIAMQLVLYCL